MDNFEDEILLDDDIDVLDIIEFGFPRRFYRRENYFESMDNLTFFRRFRLMKETILYLLPLLEDSLEFDNDLNNSVAPIDQLLATLRFYASAGHLASVADFMKMDVSTASRIIAKVSLTIAKLYPQFIKMPQNEEIIETQVSFHRKASFPKVIGCVDGTHVRIQSPGGEDAEVFRNRKGYFSLNVQAVCNANLKLLDVVARWPGSANDATIFNHSRLKRRLENNEFQNGIVLGDSAYPLKNYFLTPLLNPQRPEERLYNESHIRTRNTIERCFGVWKRRFPVLAYGLRLKLETVMHIIIATAVLHNIAIMQNEELPPQPEDIDDSELNNLIINQNIPEIQQNHLNTSNSFRTQLINDYFQNLTHQ